MKKTFVVSYEEKMATARSWPRRRGNIIIPEGQLLCTDCKQVKDKDLFQKMTLYNIEGMCVYCFNSPKERYSYGENIISYDHKGVQYGFH